MKLITADNKKYIYVLLVICTFEIISTGLLPYFKGTFFQNLQDFSPNVWHYFMLFAINLGVLEASQAFKSFTVVKAAQGGRKTTTPLYIHHYQKTTCAAQRLQDDIRLYYQNTLTVYTEYAISILVTVMLVTINVTQPLLIALALGYSAVSLGAAKFFNKSMRHAENITQQAETDYRDSIRAHEQLKKLPDAIAATLVANAIRLRYTLFARVQNLILNYAPYAVMIPLFLAHKVNLGEFMQMSATFTLITLNTTILIQLYPTLTIGQACHDRIKELTNG